MLSIKVACGDTSGADPGGGGGGGGGGSPPFPLLTTPCLYVDQLTVLKPTTNKLKGSSMLDFMFWMETACDSQTEIRYRVNSC